MVSKLFEKNFIFDFNLILIKHFEIFFVNL